jgi:hypothetical protein
VKRNRDSSVASSSSRISEELEDQEDLLDNEYGSENENLSGGNCLLKNFFNADRYSKKEIKASQPIGE